MPIEAACGSRISARATILIALLITDPGAFAAQTVTESSVVVIRTSSGPVEGRVEGPLIAFRGIPYAAPPVGDRRWRAPQAPDGWSSPRKAHDYGFACPQPRPYRESEDCLYLNVFTSPTSVRRPVMVWVHGGGFINGSGAVGTRFDALEPATFVRDGVVLVSFNYRLGRLGVFEHPALVSSRSPGEPFGNFGLMDAIAALEWVQTNIAEFGGDPARVTLFGVSAGASMINLLMVSPRAEGLFHAAISQSGANGLSRLRHAHDARPDMPSLASLGEAFAKRHGIDGAADIASALRALPVAVAAPENTSVSYRSAISPVIDGAVVTVAPREAFSRGIQHAVPYIAGGNSFEGSLASATPDPALADKIRGNPEHYEALYGLDRTDRRLAAMLYGDTAFLAPARFLVAAMSEAGEPGWHYHFDYVLEAIAGEVSGAHHGSEVVYVFDALPPVFSPTPLHARSLGIEARDYRVSDQDRRIAAAIHGRWVEFATTGNPNRPGLPPWPAYDRRTRATLVFDNTSPRVVRGLHDERLNAVEHELTKSEQ